MKIKSDDKKIGQLLKAEFFSIPDFQRPYSWESDHIDDFWDDTIKSEEEDYFIGSMVVFREHDDGLRIVDGQQRMTTVVMMLAALRDAFVREGFDSLVVGIEQYIQRPNKHGEIEPVLNPASSFPYFHDYILSSDPEKHFAGPVSEEEKGIESAFAQISGRVNEVVASVKNDSSILDAKKNGLLESKLSRIRDRLTALHVIFVELDDRDDAHLIFETLNTRGKDLTVADLVKNLVIRLIRYRGAKTNMATAQWQKIVEVIDNSSADIKLDNFLHHYWLSKYDYLHQKKLYGAIKMRIKRKGDAQRLLKELLEEVVWYRWIFEPEARKWKQQELQIRNALEALIIFRVKQPVPMVLAVLRAWVTKKIKSKSARRVLQGIENFHFNFTAITSQRSSGGISQMYAKSARELNAADTAVERDKVIDELLQKLKVKQTGYEEFNLNFREHIYTKRNSKEAALICYTLGRLHNSYNKAHPVNYNQMSIEHLVAESSGGPEPDDEFDRKVGQIGNLLLIPQDLNSELGNKEANVKLSRLKKEGYQFDPILSQVSEFEFGIAEKQTAVLAERAYKVVWKLH